MAPGAQPMKKTPLQLVKERFGDKQKLVDAVQQLATEDLWLDRLSDVKGLGRVSNQKLLRIHTALTRAKEEFGSRGKLIGAILDLEKRAKDDGLKARLEKYPLPKLLDLHRAAVRRRKVADAKATASTPKKKLARSKKAKLKAKAA
jgi:hypothetical protein